MVYRTAASRPIVLLSLVLAWVAPLLSAGEPEPSREVQSLRAFAKMYGYARFFHPSDEAASIDWDRFAVLGVIRIREVSSPEDLLPAMERLFLPLAPTVQIYPTGHAPDPLATVDPLANLEVVAWQHQGVGLSDANPVYQSKRIARDLEVQAGSPFGTIGQNIDAAPYRGRGIKLTAKMRAVVSGEGNQGHMWLRVDRPDGQRGFFDNMGRRPVTSDEWQDVEILGSVAEDASHIVIGCFLMGRGEVWVDDFRLFVDDDSGKWTPIGIENSDFEQGDAGQPPQGWWGKSPDYEFEVTGDSPALGDQSVKILNSPPILVTEDLFEARPALGEFIETDLGAGLSARIPMALPSDGTTTLPRGDERRLKMMTTELDSIAMNFLYAESECTRLSGIVIAWNALQHFYPYFDVVDVDWDRELTTALESGLTDETAEDYLATLRKLAAALQDGHAIVDNPRVRPTGFLPVSVAWVEGRVVVTADGHPTLERGDIIESFDGADIQVVLKTLEQENSGSPQYKRYLAVSKLGAGEEGSPVQLGISRGGEKIDLTVQRASAEGVVRRTLPPMIEEIEEGVFYVDLDRAAMADIDARMTEIASARGVIFDLRGYPKGTHQVIAHLLTEPDTSKDWMRVPQIIHPDHVEPVGWQNHGWEVQPIEPQIGGRVVFITDERAISAAESVLGLVAGYELAEIVGQPTAGTNGNINPIDLPGHSEFYWTGMKVVKLDGSQHHLIGIQPTVPVEPTILGVNEGRDELLEKALEVVSPD